MAGKLLSESKAIIPSIETTIGFLASTVRHGYLSSARKNRNLGIYQKKMSYVSFFCRLL
jgi:hypothetical protein